MSESRMPQLEGNPIWFDLCTPDTDGAKAFYTGLFGWEWADVPMSSGNRYHMAIDGDANIVGMYLQQESEMPEDAVRVWNNHVFVADADATVRRIEANGGSLLSGPHNADGWGITARVATPENAVFSLWQSLNGHGADVFAAPSAVCWVEYHTHDVIGAKRFYSDVFGADFQEIRMPAGEDSDGEFVLDMLTIDGQAMSCAFAQQERKSSPASWATYFMVEDIDAPINNALLLGGEQVTDIRVVPPGSSATLVDPQGVEFSLWQSAS